MKLLKLVFSRLLRLLVWVIKLPWRIISWPFRGWKNFGLTIFGALILVYFAFIELRFYVLVERYGGYEKFFCLEGMTSRELKNKIVRIVGGYSEGSGFYIAPDQVLTNYHVIFNEPSPKVILPDGQFVTPIKITAHKDADLAVLYIPGSNYPMVLPHQSPRLLQPYEPLLSAGYPLGTALKGEPTITKGQFISVSRTADDVVDYIRTNISLVEGMSGGPLVDQCGNVVGINTMSIAGLSFFVSRDSILDLLPEFTDEDVAKVEVDASVSPAEAVKAFYFYLKSRQLQQGFGLLSSDYLTRTNFEEWTSRFSQVLDVQVYSTEPVQGKDNEVYVKFDTKNWVNEEAQIHFYEGIWETVWEDGVYKLDSSNIIEIENPAWDWFDL